VPASLAISTAPLSKAATSSLVCSLATFFMTNEQEQQPSDHLLAGG
jgi:hypothetical protein